MTATNNSLTETLETNINAIISKSDSELEANWSGDAATKFRARQEELVNCVNEMKVQTSLFESVTKCAEDLKKTEDEIKVLEEKILEKQTELSTLQSELTNKQTMQAIKKDSKTTSTLETIVSDIEIETLRTKIEALQKEILELEADLETKKEEKESKINEIKGILIEIIDIKISLDDAQLYSTPLSKDGIQLLNNDRRKELKEQFIEAGENYTETPEFTKYKIIYENGEKYSSSIANYPGETHKGMDFKTPEGTPVQSPVSGKVVGVRTKKDSNGNFTSYGRWVVIEDENNNYHYFAHLSGFNCEEGQVVERGAVIGYSGSAGRGNNPHLHYEVRKNDDYSQQVNPRNFLELGDV